MAIVDKINEENEQVIYDALFMSEPEWCLVYGELYRSYKKDELKEIWDRIRDDYFENKRTFNKKLKKTRISALSSGDVRRSHESEKMERADPPPKKEDPEDDLHQPKQKGSLKNDIIKLHEEGKSRTEIRNTLGCKYQYVFQTVKKYEQAREVD